MGEAGLYSRNDESASKHKSTATTKGNKNLCSILIKASSVTSRMKDSLFKNKFNRLAMHKPRNMALFAFVTKLLVVI